MNPFDYVTSISHSKADLMTDELEEKSYPAFLVNKGLSYFTDTVLYANEMNLRGHLDNKLQYSYLLNSIRPAKRFAKWVKKEDSNDLDAVKEYYGYSNEKASHALSILSPDELVMLKEQLQRGGVHESGRQSNRGATKERR